MGGAKRLLIGTQPQVLADVQSADSTDLSMLSVALQELTNLIDSKPTRCREPITTSRAQD